MMNAYTIYKIEPGPNGTWLASYRDDPSSGSSGLLPSFAEAVAWLERAYRARYVARREIEVERWLDAHNKEGKT